MKNVIIFINICIVASVTMMVIDFEETATAPVTLASMPKNSGETKTAKDEKGKSGISTPRLIGRSSEKTKARPLSKKESLFIHQFVTNMAQRRLLERERSKLATQRGTSRALKDFGAWMVLSQQQMLDDLNRVASVRAWQVPESLSPELTRDLSEMHELHGRRFETRYIKAMKATLKSDIKMLEQASYSSDAEVQVFAVRYLPMAKDNLAKLQRLKR